jgi:GNAT superfamily N-acetyltransferase
VTVSLRPVRSAAEAAAVGPVHLASRAAAYAGLIPADALDATPAAAMAQWWAERWRWEHDTHLLTVAVDGPAVVGFTYVGPSETPGAAELYGVHVAPERVGTGVGRLLMVSALEQLRGLGEPRAVLWVLAGNARARRFYERGGWAADGAERSEPIGTAMTVQLRYGKELGGST